MRRSSDRPLQLCAQFDTMTDIEARHKKELKALDTEKRSALKKIKGTAGKGKKAKELLAA